MPKFRFLISATLVCCAWLAGQANANVVITGSRIIYPSDARERSLHMSNRAEYPSLVQAWMDRGSEDSTPETADAPFIVTPPVFRMEGRSGQSIRLRFTGEDLPADRESLFFLNVLQIPPSHVDQEGRNQFVIMPRHRLKVFYRPRTIAQAPQQVPDLLSFDVRAEGDHWLIGVRNPTGYFVTFSEVDAGLREQRAPVAFDSSLAPFSKAEWRVPRDSLPGQPESLRLLLVTDLGGRLEKHIPLTR